MKKLFSLLMLLCAGVALHAENEVLFVYTQWGTDAFLKSEIDSITYSHYDEENIYHSEWYAQIIHTPDSAYYYPLFLMDNMEFKSTEHVYQSDVKEMSDDLLSYIIAYTDSTLTLQPKTPTQLIPAVGEVLYYEGNEQPLVEGFAGRMKGLDTYSDSLVCLFDSVGLHDVFKKLLMVSTIESTTDDGLKRAKGNKEGFSLPSVLNKKFEADGDLEGKVDLDFKLINPKLTIKTIIELNNDNHSKDYAKITMHFESEGEASGTLGIEGSGTLDIAMIDPKEIHIEKFAGKFKLSALAELSGEIHGSVAIPFSCAYTRSYEYKYSRWKEVESDKIKDHFTWEDPSLELPGFNGSFFAGFKAELQGGVLSTLLDNFTIEGKAGFEFSANYPSLDFLTDSDRYNTLKEASFERKLTISVNTQIQLLQTPILFGPSLEWNFGQKTWPVIPKIDNLKWKPTDIRKGELTSNVSGNLLFPMTFGWVMNDQNGVRSREGFFSNKYKGNSDNPIQETRMKVEDLPQNYHYWAYPAVKFMGLIVPYTESVEVKPSMVIISDFKVTNSQYKKEGFENDDQKYDFKYNASVKLTLDENIDSSNISDWGYIYYDLNGDTVHISMKGKHSPYVDTRYAYYRNDIFSTVKLCGYVQFKDHWNYEYDDPLTFDLIFNFCPDNNHPHMIDLGLPSGTKWACCDVGAERPGEQGLLYAWGETKPKDEYLQTNYKFYHGTDINGDDYYFTYIDENEPIKYYAEYKDYDGKHYQEHLSYERCMQLKDQGRLYSWSECIHEHPEPWYIVIPRYDIAGTGFDAATVNWGSRWRMPSSTQARELLKNCDMRNCTDRHGHTYQMLGGPNGKVILISSDPHWISKSPYCSKRKSPKSTYCEAYEWANGHYNYFCSAYAFDLFEFVSNEDEYDNYDDYEEEGYYDYYDDTASCGNLVRAVSKPVE